MLKQTSVAPADSGYCNGGIEYSLESIVFILMFALIILYFWRRYRLLPHIAKLKANFDKGIPNTDCYYSDGKMFCIHPKNFIQNCVMERCPKLNHKTEFEKKQIIITDEKNPIAKIVITLNDEIETETFLEGFPKNFPTMKEQYLVLEKDKENIILDDAMIENEDKKKNRWTNLLIEFDNCGNCSDETCVLLDAVKENFEKGEPNHSCCYGEEYTLNEITCEHPKNMDGPCTKEDCPRIQKKEAN